MIRMIFSTVRAPHEPALTVESFAITQTGRPRMVAIPVITPSAGRPSDNALAKRPSSTNDPGSTRWAIRSRAKSLPFAAFAAWYFSAPPARIRVRIRSNSEGLSVTPAPSSHAARRTPATSINLTIVRLTHIGRFVDRSAGQRQARPRAQHPRRQLTPHDLLGESGRLQQRAQVDAGVDAHVVQHVHHLLSGHIPAGSRRVRAAAQPADARVELGDTQLQRGEDVG